MLATTFAVCCVLIISAKNVSLLPATLLRAAALLIARFFYYGFNLSGRIYCIHYSELYIFYIIDTMVIILKYTKCVLYLGMNAVLKNDGSKNNAICKHDY